MKSKPPPRCDPRSRRPHLHSAGLLAQGLKPLDAARLGASIHGAAADAVAASQGERGMAASDLLPHILRLVNPVWRASRVAWDPPLNPE